MQNLQSGFSRQLFHWIKQPDGLRKVRHLGRWKIQQVAHRETQGAAT